MTDSRCPTCGARTNSDEQLAGFAAMCDACSTSHARRAIRIRNILVARGLTTGHENCVLIAAGDRAEARLMVTK